MSGLDISLAVIAAFFALCWAKVRMNLFGTKDKIADLQGYKDKADPYIGRLVKEIQELKAERDMAEQGLKHESERLEKVRELLGMSGMAVDANQNEAPGEFWR